MTVQQPVYFCSTLRNEHTSYIKINVKRFQAMNAYNPFVLSTVDMSRLHRMVVLSFS